MCLILRPIGKRHLVAGIPRVIPVPPPHRDRVTGPVAGIRDKQDIGPARVVCGKVCDRIAVRATVRDYTPPEALSFQIRPPRRIPRWHFFPVKTLAAKLGIGLIPRLPGGKSASPNNTIAGSPFERIQIEIYPHCFPHIRTVHRGQGSPRSAGKCDSMSIS